MLIYENKKAKLIYILKSGINPFRKFVSTGEIKEEIGFVQSRNELLDSIQKTIDDENNQNFILPIIGPVGTGKTHLYWALKEKLLNYYTIYISIENVYRKFYYNLYSKYIEDIGIEVLRSITNKLCGQWGSLERKYGFFHVADIEKVRRTAYSLLLQDYDDNIALNDVINVITAHQLDPYRKIEAENWILGELMDFKDLSHLHLLYDLKRGSYAYTMLKIIIENSMLKTLLFIDDFEKVLSLMKHDEEVEEIFDPSYLYGKSTESPESITAMKALERILKLQDIHGLRIIITLKSIESLDEIKKIVKDKYEKSTITFKDPYLIADFIENDIFAFYKKSMNMFLKNVAFEEFPEDSQNPFFPLNQKVLQKVYNDSKGNPRQIIKNLIQIFNDIIFSNEDLKDLLKKYEN